MLGAHVSSIEFRGSGNTYASIRGMINDNELRGGTHNGTLFTSQENYIRAISSALYGF